MTQNFNFSPEPGQLDRFENGALAGYITQTAFPGTASTVTLEFFAHGIVVASGHASRNDADQNGNVPFSIPVQRFPEVAVPCRITAHVVETDEPLATYVKLESIEHVWQGLLSCQACLDGVEQGAVRIRISGNASPLEDPTFELSDGSHSLSVDQNVETDASGDQIVSIDLPSRLLDGTAHDIQIIHAQSRLPVSQQPLKLRLELDESHSISNHILLKRIEELERLAQDSYSRVFNDFALALYRHIDTVTLNQRANLEREMAALRSALSGKEIALPQTERPTQTYVDLADPVRGYGLLSLIDGVGRKVGHVSGVLWPGMVAQAMELTVTGHEDSFARRDIAQLFVNGHAVQSRLVTPEEGGAPAMIATVAMEMIRTDSNLVEFRLADDIAIDGHDVILTSISFRPLEASE